MSPRYKSKKPAHIRKEIVSRYLAGEFQRTIARSFKISPDSVLIILKEEGVFKPRRLLGDYPKALARCAELAASGVPVANAVQQTNDEHGINFSIQAYGSGMARAGLYFVPRLRGVGAASSEPVKLHQTKQFVTFGEIVIRTTKNAAGISLPLVPSLNRPLLDIGAAA